MKIKVNEVIRDYQGKEVTEPEMIDGKSTLKKITVRQILGAALMRQVPGEQPTAEDFAKRHQLSIKLFKNNEPDFTDNEKVFLRKLVVQIGNHLYYGRIDDIFEGKGQDVPEVKA